MANHGYKFIDPDLHVFEPSDLWTRYIEPRFRDQVMGGPPKGSAQGARMPGVFQLGRVQNRLHLDPDRVTNLEWQ